MHQLLVLLLVLKEALVKSTIAEQQLQHLHLLAEALVAHNSQQQEDKAAQVAEVLIIMRVVKETLLQLLLVKEMMERLALIQETVGLLAEAAEPMLLELVEVAQDSMVLAQVAQEAMEQPIQ